jgi:1-acyl-sn-glycerol-3-phosphate acyltransferase
VVARAVLAGRILGLTAVMVAGVAAAPLLALISRRTRGALTGTLARAALRALGVRLSVRGQSPRRGSLLVANHVSWLDVIVLLAVTPARMLAKREVRDWPVVGGLATATGTVFLDRARPRALPRTVADVAAALRAGASVAVFPEGTTSCGLDGSGFRPAMFQAAIDAGTPVVPLGIAYSSTAAAFVGEDTLFDSVRRVAAVRGLTVTLTISPALHPASGADRRTLARAAASAVGALPRVRAGLSRAAGLGLAA